MTKRGIVSPNRLWVAMFAIVLSLIARPVIGQELQDPAEQHGWAVLSMGEHFSLVHLPPRAVVADAKGYSAQASDGEMNLVKELRYKPHRVISAGRTAFLVFDPQVERGEESMRSVLSVTAELSPLGNQWTTNAAGRLEVRAGLSGLQPIVDGVGFRFSGQRDDRCAVLLGEIGRSPLSVRVLDGTSWASLRLPTGLERTDRVRLASRDGDLLLIARMSDGTGWIGWRGEVSPGFMSIAETEVGADEDEVAIWTPPQVDWAEAGAWSALEVGTDAGVHAIGKAIITSQIDIDGRWVVRAVRAEESVQMVSRAVQGEAVATVVSGIGVSTRLILIQSDQAANAGGVEGERAEAQELRGKLPARLAGSKLVEVSAFTGRVLYDGPTKSTSPFSINEYAILGLLALALALGVLVYVFVPDKDDGVVRLPEGAALAEPFRRVAAASADVALAMLVATWGIGKAADSGYIEYASSETGALIMMFIGAYFHGVLGEWVCGRTIGKVLMGCRVVGTRGRTAPRVTLSQALLRNVVKFAMPPVALLGLMDVNSRHRGDVLAGTAVVVAVEDDDHEPGDDASSDQSDDGFDEVSQEDESES